MLLYNNDLGKVTFGIKETKNISGNGQFISFCKTSISSGTYILIATAEYNVIMNGGNINRAVYLASDNSFESGEKLEGYACTCGDGGWASAIVIGFLVCTSPKIIYCRCCQNSGSNVNVNCKLSYMKIR